MVIGVDSPLVSSFYDIWVGVFCIAVDKMSRVGLSAI